MTTQVKDAVVDAPVQQVKDSPVRDVVAQQVDDALATVERLEQVKVGITTVVGMLGIALAAIIVAEAHGIHVASSIF